MLASIGLSHLFTNTVKQEDLLPLEREIEASEKVMDSTRLSEDLDEQAGSVVTRCLYVDTDRLILFYWSNSITVLLI